ncbi:MAG: hypothetical protein GF388_09330 [Candidatus Aegiribacteria sp.]|nr:hypothetical protein [Candidatus Aegiribacteria sp.]MBD3295258.1 hypothetical protein [Candidatus Fermentibacteria bacterium]
MDEKEVKKLDSRKLGPFIIATSIVWGAVMVVSAFMLKGTDYMQKLLPVLGSGAVISVIFLPMMLLKKKQDC